MGGVCMRTIFTCLHAVIALRWSEDAHSADDIGNFRQTMDNDHLVRNTLLDDYGHLL
jgi:hypothetical protein